MSARAQRREAETVAGRFRVVPRGETAFEVRDDQGRQRGLFRAYVKGLFIDNNVPTPEALAAAEADATLFRDALRAQAVSL